MPVSQQELNDQFDKLVAVCLKVKRDRDELLEASEYALSVLNSHPDTGNNTEFNELRATLYAAITKATRRS